MKVAYGTISNYQLSDTFKIISDAYMAREDEIYNYQMQQMSIVLKKTGCIKAYYIAVKIL